MITIGKPVLRLKGSSSFINRSYVSFSFLKGQEKVALVAGRPPILRLDANDLSIEFSLNPKLTTEDLAVVLERAVLDEVNQLIQDANIVVRRGHGANIGGMGEFGYYHLEVKCDPSIVSLVVDKRAAAYTTWFR